MGAAFSAIIVSAGANGMARTDAIAGRGRMGVKGRLLSVPVRSGMRQRTANIHGPPRWGAICVSP